MQAEYLQLLRKVRSISDELLPPISPTASYDDGQILRMLAFRLSAHAEIEGFVELCAQDLVDHFATKNRNKTLSRQVQRLLIMHFEMRESYPPRSLNLDTSHKTPVEKRVASCLTTQENHIAQNNGVSEKDILKLFVPLGFEFAFFDLAWLNSMRELAHARGDAAHNSWLGGTRIQPNPTDERRRFAKPLLGLRRLVAEAARLKSVS